MLLSSLNSLTKFIKSSFLATKSVSQLTSIIEDLVSAAHNNAKIQLKSKTSEEISKATGGIGMPGFKWPI